MAKPHKSKPKTQAPWQAQLTKARRLAEDGRARAAGESIEAFLNGPAARTAGPKVKPAAAAMANYALKLATGAGLAAGDALFLAEVAARAYLRAGRDADQVAAIGLQGDLLRAGGAGFDAAGGRYVCAATLAERANLSTAAIEMWLRQAQNAFASGNLAVAKQVALHAMKIGQADCAADEVGRAAAGQLLLNVTLRTEEFEHTITVANVARQLFLRHGMPLHAADVDRAEAEARWRLFDIPGATRAIMRARQAYVQADDRINVAVCDFQRARMMQATPQARELLKSARTAFLEHSQPVDVARCDITLGQYERASGDLEATEKLTRGAADTFSSHGMASDAARAQYALGEVLTAQGRHRDAIQVLQRARRTHLAAGEYAAAANCDTKLAWAHWHIGDHDGALNAALAALSTLDRQRYSMSNQQSREQWAQTHFSLFGLALDSAASRGDDRLIAELVESARGQSIPAESETAPHPRGPRSDVDQSQALPEGMPTWAERVWVDPLPLEAAPCISVGGHCALADADPSDGRVHARGPVQLETAAAEIGGADAWWWGTLQTVDALWWSLIGPDGHIEAGRIDYSAGSRARRAIETLYDAVPIRVGGEDDTDFTRRVSGGALADPGTEEALADELGEALLPEPLRDVLTKALTGLPASLIAAPCPALAPLPLCAVGIGDGRRLIEAATLRYSPSVAFVTRVAAQAARGLRGCGGPGPIVGGLFDPDRNRPLRHAAHLASHIGGDLLIAERATKRALAGTLEAAGVQPGTPGVFVYCGHARTPRVAGVALLCLHNDMSESDSCPIENCCGGAPLTSSQLCVQRPGQGACPYPMPGRVLLSACDTSGAASAGHGGEWLALAPGMLWAGARLVVSTSWPTLDDPRTLECDIAVVDVLKTHPDPALALRDIQMEKLQRWRTGVRDDVRLSPIRGWSPLFWAPYVAVGFRAC